MAETTIKLADGNEMPLVGFGTYLINTQELMDTSIKNRILTLVIDYSTRLNFTAMRIFLGQTLVNLQIPRDQIFITSKIAEISQGYENTIKSIDGSLERLKTNYLDLLLVHWPVQEYFFDTWRALEKLKADGKVKSIGVSNFSVAHLELLKTQAKEMPVVNQVERHPYLNQRALVAFDKAQNIVTQAWSPLGRGVTLDNEMLKKMYHHHVSVAQLIFKVAPAKWRSSHPKV